MPPVPRRSAIRRTVGALLVLSLAACAEETTDRDLPTVDGGRPDAAAGPAEAIWAEQPFALTRNPEGVWSDAPWDDEPLPTIVRTEKKAMRLVSTGAATPEGGMLRARSLLVVAVADDPMTARCVRRCIEILRAEGGFERIAFTPLDRPLEPGLRRPDLFLCIDHPASGKQATLGSQLFRGNTSRAEPLLWARAMDLGARIEIDAETIATTAEGTFENDDLAIADLVGDEIAQAVLETIGSAVEGRGIHPEDPALFVPAFEPVEAAALPLEALGPLERFASFHGPFLANQTWWRGAIPRDHGAQLATLTGDLEAAGFRDNRAASPELFFTRGRDDLQILVDPDPHLPRAGNDQVPVVVRFRRRADRTFVDDAISRAIAGEAPPAVWTLMHQVFGSEHGTEALAYWEKVPPSSIDEFLTRAQLLGDDAPEAAAADVVRAHRLALGTIRGERFEGWVENIAQRLAVDLDALGKPDAAQLEAAGFVALPPAGQEISGTVAPGQEWRGFVETEKGPLLVVAGLRGAGGAGPTAVVRLVSPDGASLESSVEGLGSVSPMRLQDITAIGVRFTRAEDGTTTVHIKRREP